MLPSGTQLHKLAKGFLFAHSSLFMVKRSCVKAAASADHHQAVARGAKAHNCLGVLRQAKLGERPLRRKVWHWQQRLQQRTSVQSHWQARVLLAPAPQLLYAPTCIVWSHAPRWYPSRLPDHTWLLVYVSICVKASVLYAAVIRTCSLCMTTLQPCSNAPHSGIDSIKQLCIYARPRTHPHKRNIGSR